MGRQGVAAIGRLKVKSCLAPYRCAMPLRLSAILIPTYDGTRELAVGFLLLSRNTKTKLLAQVCDVCQQLVVGGTS